VMLSELFAHGGDRFAIAKELCERCNALGQMDTSAVEEEKAKEETVKKIYVA